MAIDCCRGLACGFDSSRRRVLLRVAHNKIDRQATTNSTNWLFADQLSPGIHTKYRFTGIEIIRDRLILGPRLGFDRNDIQGYRF